MGPIGCPKRLFGNTFLHCTKIPKNNADVKRKSMDKQVRTGAKLKKKLVRVTQGILLMFT